MEKANPGKKKGKVPLCDERKIKFFDVISFFVCLYLQRYELPEFELVPPGVE